MSEEVFVVLQPDFAINGRASIARDGKSIAQECLSLTSRLADQVALEQALRLREKGHVSRVTCVAACSSAAEDILTQAMASGADRALRIDTGDDLYIDAQAVGQKIANEITGLNGELVFTGSWSGDGNGDLMPHVIAAGLGAACLSNTMNVEISADRVQIERRIEKGHRQIWEAILPAVVAFDPSATAPRYVPVAAQILARRRSITVIDPVLSVEQPATALRKFIPARIRAKRVSVAPAHQTVQERMQATVAGGVSKKKSSTTLSGPPHQVADQIIAFLEERKFLGGAE